MKSRTNAEVDALRAEVAALRAQGLLFREIAEQLGVPASTARRLGRGRELSDHLCDCGCGQRTYVNDGKVARYCLNHHPISNYRPDAVERFWQNVRVDESGCWEWTGGMDTNGYGVLRVDGKKTKAHRFSYTLHFGPIPDGLVVRHRCDQPPCVNPAHLEVGTQADNVRDRETRGRGHDRSGVLNPKAKLTEDDVRAIRRRLASGESQTSIAADFGVTQVNVSAIHLGQTWKHVTEEARR